MGHEKWISDYGYSRADIIAQVDRINTDTSFMESDILKRMLFFVVNETLEGRSNRLKEYTIAINVLNKSASFKPQENGIVRIHAGRLRRALSHYYDDKGSADSIRITMPKGGYVPFFGRPEDLNLNFPRFSQAFI